MKKLKLIESKKGITLIALVITIIVLLILAGVSIAMLTGENGILTQAKEAKTKTEIAQWEERIDLAIITVEGNKKYENVTINEIIEELKKQKIITNNNQVNITTGDITTNEPTYIIKGKLDKYLNKEYAPVEYDFGEIKNISVSLENSNIVDGMFVIQIISNENLVIGEAANNENGQFNLTELKQTYNKPGVYTYKVKQIINNQTDINYDTNIYTLTINVKDINGILVVEPENTPIIFYNSYAEFEEKSIVINASVVLTGGTLNANQFEFQLKDESGKIVDTVYNNQDGTIIFKQLTFNKAGVYKYTVGQVNKNEANYVYDTNVYEVVITVTNEDINISGNVVIFNNEYKNLETDAQ